MPHPATLQHWLDCCLAEESSDSLLLKAVLSRRDEAAFASLVHRHGPMVLGVCHRLLGDGPDAEEAFQATFLVLLDKAAALVPLRSLASWLHEVARQCALNVGQSRRGQARWQGPLQDTALATRSTSSALTALDSILDREIAVLPRNDREVLLSFGEDAESRKLAVSRLRIPERTVGARLSKARKKLQARLRHQGIELGNVPLGVTVSRSLLASTVQMIRDFGMAGSSAMLPSGAVKLSQAVLHSMRRSRVKKFMIGILLFIAVICGGWMVSHRPTPIVDEQRADSPPKPAKSSATYISNKPLSPNPSGVLDRNLVQESPHSVHDKNLSQDTTPEETMSLSREDLVKGVIDRSKAVRSGEYLYEMSLFDHHDTRQIHLVISEDRWKTMHKIDLSEVNSFSANGVDATTVGPITGEYSTTTIDLGTISAEYQVRAETGKTVSRSVRVTNTTKELFGHFDPRVAVFLGTFPYQPTREFVAKHKDQAVLRGHALLDGQKVYILEWTVHKDQLAALDSSNEVTEHGARIRAYVAPSLGFAIPRLEFVGLDGSIAKLFESSAFQKINGIHIPMIGTIQCFTLQGPGYNETYTISQVKRLNESIDKSEFMFKIPVGTGITDETNGDPPRRFNASYYFDVSPHLDDLLLVEDPKLKMLQESRESSDLSPSLARTPLSANAPGKVQPVGDLESSRWEYKVLTNIDPVADLQFELNALGMQGWELLPVAQQGQLILKRRKQTTTEHP